MSEPADEDYWAVYSNLQQVKHDLIRFYLQGWFPKLGSWSGRVLYVDTHAGRGRHLSGELGSPLVALRSLLEHSYRDQLLRRCEFEFHLIERNGLNFSALEREIAGLRPLPRGVRILPHLGDAFAHLSAIVSELRALAAPAFVFVDPYGFKIPGTLLRQLMQLERTELFVNVIWRELGMALAQRMVAPGMAATLTDIFIGEEWRSELCEPGLDFDTRADRAVDLLARKLGGRWATAIRMLGNNDVTRYLLVHFTNHDAGRDLMKNAMWRVCPSGGFFARRADDPAQPFLISPDPDLRPLREWILGCLGHGPRRWAELIELARPTNWRDVQVNQVVRELLKQGAISASSYSGKVSLKANPLLARCL